MSRRPPPRRRRAADPPIRVIFEGATDPEPGAEERAIAALIDFMDRREAERVG